MTAIAERRSELEQRASAASVRSGRAAHAAQILAVTKTVPEQIVHEAYLAGQRLFAENYVQEARSKYSALVAKEGVALEVHFIGHLQRNKVKDAVGLFELIHTVDRLELARALDAAAANAGKTQRVLMQVNVSLEESKSGAAPADAENLAAEISRLPNLRLEGLMCIGSYIPPDAPEDERRREFRALRAMRDTIGKHIGLDLPHLSMGMSHDFEAAIEEGATFVRLGTAFFGERQTR